MDRFVTWKDTEVIDALMDRVSRIIEAGRVPIGPYLDYLVGHLPDGVAAANWSALAKKAGFVEKSKLPSKDTSGTAEVESEEERQHKALQKTIAESIKWLSANYYIHILPLSGQHDIPDDISAKPASQIFGDRLQKFHRVYKNLEFDAQSQISKAVILHPNDLVKEIQAALDTLQEFELWDPKRQVTSQESDHPPVYHPAGLHIAFPKGTSRGRTMEKEVRKMFVVLTYSECNELINLPPGFSAGGITDKIEYTEEQWRASRKWHIEKLAGSVFKLDEEEFKRRYLKGLI